MQRLGALILLLIQPGHISFDFIFIVVSFCMFSHQNSNLSRGKAFRFAYLRTYTVRYLGTSALSL